MSLNYSATKEPNGVEITDNIKQRKLQIYSDREVTPTPTNSQLFEFPVDAAFTIEARKLSMNRSDEVYIRSMDGEFDGPIGGRQTVSLKKNTYSFDISSPVKIYLKFTGAPTIIKGTGSLQVTFPERTSVVFGVRTYHKHPSGTVTTTSHPEDMMAAINTLPSALKTMSCERSYPTLRGYPPLIQIGEELNIPDDLVAPETGLVFEVPRKLSYIYTAAPLAFYLGAELVPGKSPKLVTPDFTYDFEDGEWFEDSVAKLLQKVLFLDCVVRTIGIHQVELYERKKIEQKLPFEVEEAYDIPLSDQFKLYTAVDFEDIRPYLPRWCLTAYLPDVPESAEAIPHIVNDLGIVRETKASTRTISRAVSDAPKRFMESGVESCRSSDEPVEMTIAEPVRKDTSIEHAWFGNQIPLGASKASVDSFDHQLSQRNRNESIDITVICNDPHMVDEQHTLDNVYGDREDQPYNVDSYFGVSRDELESILVEDSCDFLHYIGHATPEGLRCNDGKLDIRELSNIGVNVFLLNACRSFEQAEALIEKGSFGGVATLGDVVNEQAIEIGQAAAHLLNLGFPLRAAAELIHQHHSIGEQYLIVGDGSVDIVQTDSGVPIVNQVNQIDDERYELTISSFPTKKFQLGSRATPSLEGVNEYFLLPGPMKAFEVSREELVEYLTWTMYPFEINGRIKWNDTLGIVDL